MRKKYLKTIEDVEALRNTDTKIYERHYTNSYWKFVNGVLCKFYTDTNGVTYNISFTIDNNSNFYIEVEDEPSEDWLGKLVVFSNGYGFKEDIGVLKKSTCEDYPYLCAGSFNEYKHFRPLTPEEVKKYTGYKVVKED